MKVTLFCCETNLKE